MKYFKKIIAFVLAVTMVSALFTVTALAGSEWETVTREEYIIDNWRYKAVNSDSLAYIDQTESSNGKNSLKLYSKTLRGSGESYIWVAKPVSVKKGKTYKLTFDVKIEKAVSDVSFRFDWAGWSLIPSVTTYDWTSFVFTYESQKDGNMELRWGADNKIGGMWIDNIEFLDVENPEENLVDNGSFEDLSALKQTTGTFSAEAAGADGDMFSKSNIKVTLDGKDDEWSEVEPTEIAQLYDHTNGTWMKQGVVPITGNVRFAHDDENLYFVVVVKDAVHFQNQKISEFWKGDSIQFGIADPALDEPVMIERWLALNSETGEIFKHGDNFEGVVTREGDVTTYEVALPWSADFGGEIPAEMRFNVIVNNNDGEGRVYDIEITPGISNGKDYSKFNFLRMWQKVGSLQQNSYVPKAVNANDKSTVKLTFFNENKTEKNVMVEFANTGLKKNIKIAPDEIKNLNIDFETGDVGEKELCIKVVCDGEENVIKKKISVSIIYNEQTYHVFKEKMQGIVDELKELILKCEKKGLSTPYESANYSLICKFSEHFDNEAAHSDYERMYNYEIIMSNIYQKTKSKLEAYLSGDEKPLSVPQYVTSEIKNIGTTNYAMTENNGVYEERPVFFSGYNMFNESDSLIPYLRSIGVNSVQMSMEFPEFMDMFVEGVAGGFCVEYQKGSTATAEVTCEEAASGKACMKITNNQARSTGAYLQLNARLNLEPKTTYLFGLKAKGKSNKTDFIYGWDSSTRTNIPSSEEWKDYVIEFTTKENQVTETVRILCDDITEGLYIDDVYVVKKGEDSKDQNNNLICDGDFEISGKGPTDFDIRLKEELGLYLNPWGLNNVRKRLDLAEKNNIYFDFGLSWNYFEGSYLLTSDPELTGYTRRFTPFSSDQPKMRKAIEFAIEAHANVFKDYKCVKSVLIINEPQVYTNASDYYKPHWKKYLEDLYGTIDRLNENYQSSYTSFEEVEMPDRVDYTPKFYDWRNFNDSTLSEYITYLVNTFKKYCPDINVHTKGMDYFRYDYAKDLVNGFNYEQLYDIMDYNGCDAFCHYKNSNTPMTLKMGWYDFMTSLCNKPVWDTESHPLTDGTTIQPVPQEAAYVASDLWNGATHGRSGSIMWLYDIAEANSPWAGTMRWANANMRFKPDIAQRVSETNLDMMRLSKELAALQNMKRKIGLVFSRTSLGYNDEHNTATAEVYENCIFGGQRPYFITDTTFEDVKKCELVIVPKSTTNVSQGMLDTIKEYIENGGTVMLLDDISLKYDEYNKPHNEDVVKFIYDNAKKGNTVKEFIEQNDISEITLVDEKTGKLVDNTEWSYVFDDERILVNILYYSYDEESEKTFKLMYNGNEISKVAELRSNKELNGPFTVTPYEPVLYEIKKIKK